MGSYRCVCKEGYFGDGFFCSGHTNKTFSSTFTLEHVLCLRTVHVWRPLQTAMSVQKTATCVKMATVWIYPEVSDVNVTWASSPRLMAKPARVRHCSLLLFLKLLNISQHLKKVWCLVFPVWKRIHLKRSMLNTGSSACALHLEASFSIYIWFKIEVLKFGGYTM